MTASDHDRGREDPTDARTGNMHLEVYASTGLEAVRLVDELERGIAEEGLSGRATGTVATRETLQHLGIERLPAVCVAGRILVQGRALLRRELQSWLKDPGSGGQATSADGATGAVGGVPQHWAEALDPSAATPVQYAVHWKEHAYLALKVLLTVGVLGGVGVYAATNRGQALGVGLVGLVYGMPVIIYLILVRAMMVGSLRGNAIRVSERQFGDVHAMVQRFSAQLGLKKAPRVYVMQSGGMLNAFATRFLNINGNHLPNH